MYCPPARGNMAASSPQVRAPKQVMTPVSSQAMSSQPGEPTDRPMSAETMKIPDPIIAPATSMVASVRVMALMNPVCGGADDSSVGAVTFDIQIPVEAGKSARRGGAPEAGSRAKITPRPRGT